MKKVIYTVLFGDYKLYEPEVQNPEWKHICFSDRPLKSKNWDVRVIECKNKRKKSREVKILFDQYIDCDVCIYIDSKFKIKTNLNEFVDKRLKNDLCVMKHNKRECAYIEGYFCIDRGKDVKYPLSIQLEHYGKEGFPENFGLYAPGIMIRRNTEPVRNFMRLWNEQVQRYSYRDIVSFSYVLWKNPIPLDVIDFTETYRTFK
jgi:hypothetical protein